MGRSLAGHPEIRGHGLTSLLNHRISEANLVVELERSRLNSQRARCRSWLGRLVDDPHPHAQPRQPQGQHQACRSCAYDQDLGSGRLTHRG